MKTLTIISHTEHYKTLEGQVVGFGSTVAEINHLLDIFDHIYHVAMLHDQNPPENTMPYSSDKVTFVPLPALGGSRLIDKLNIVLKIPKVINIVRKTVAKSEYFQFRAPTGIGVFVIPYLILFSSKKGWFKYAGNWKQENPPLAYKFQRWLLKSQSRHVTINGQWKDQPSHCLSFENPCLTDSELESGNQLIKDKALPDGQFDLCFVGRLEEAKGIGRFIKAVTALGELNQNKINVIRIIGDGPSTGQYYEMTKKSNINFQFLGLVSRTKVHDIFKKSHAIILPSASEGFPKVIAEAMNYGCLPVVSNVSSIAEYIKDGFNGFLLQSLDEITLEQTLMRLLDISNDAYIQMIEQGHHNSKKFTFSYYNQQIEGKILKEK